MRKSPEEVIGKIQEKIDEYDVLKEERKKEVEKQEKIVNNLISENHSVYEWIKDKAKFYFIHPELNFQSKKGPILGYEQDDNRLVVYDVEKREITITDVGKKFNEDEYISAIELVRQGHFVSAVKGLNFIEEMFTVFTENVREDIERLSKETQKMK